MASKFVLKNVNLASGEITDIFIQDEKIVATGSNLTADESIDCTGLIALPGFVDLHTHLREPGFENSETVLTGSRSAAKGGFTAVHAMANTLPVADNAAVVEQIFALGNDAGYVDVYPVGAVTVGLDGKTLAEMGSMANSKAKVRVFSDDGKCVHDSGLMRRALEYSKMFDAVVAQHAQDPGLTIGSQMNEGELSAQLGLTGWPAVAEESIIARDVLLAEFLDARIHICHVSTAGSVDVIRWAKARGIKVTAEVTPHHLILTEEKALNYESVYKVNPPLRTSKDVASLREALIDGTIDIIATDHAPHPTESKDCDWNSAAFGMTGLEIAASVAQEVLINSGKSSWSRLAEVLSYNPAKIGRDLEQGQELIAGSIANIVLINPDARRVISEVSASKSKNSPYIGLELPGSVIHTIYRGYFTVRDEKLSEKGKNDR